MKTVHYEVRWKYHHTNGAVQSRTSIKETTLELAQIEARRIIDKNNLFLEVDGSRPFVSDVSIWRVETETTMTQESVWLKDAIAEVDETA